MIIGAIVEYNVKRAIRAILKLVILFINSVKELLVAEDRITDGVAHSCFVWTIGILMHRLL